jgi:hypothetical protein
MFLCERVDVDVSLREGQCRGFPARRSVKRLLGPSHVRQSQCLRPLRHTRFPSRPPSRPPPRPHRVSIITDLACSLRTMCSPGVKNTRQMWGT